MPSHGINIPYCATCYYAYLKEENQFIFTSGHETRHIRDVVEGNNYRVAGAIALETKITGKIRGIQFTGILTDVNPTQIGGAEGEGNDQGEDVDTRRGIARSRYLRRFPIARLMPGLHLWSLQPDFIKMTDNRLGFGTKLIWMAEDFRKTSNEAP